MIKRTTLIIYRTSLDVTLIRLQDKEQYAERTGRPKLWTTTENGRCRRGHHKQFITKTTPENFTVVPVC